MRSKNTIKFFLVVILQIIILIGLLIYHIGKTKGRKIFLRVGSVDPLSPIRGRYISLYYPDISSIEIYKFDYSSVKIGDVVYVKLQKVNKIWKIKKDSKISKKKPKGGIYIKGIVEFCRYSRVRLKYGIESYFIPEEYAKEFKWGKENYVEVSIDENGTAALVKLYIDGRPFP